MWCVKSCFWLYVQVHYSLQCLFGFANPSKPRITALPKCLYVLRRVGFDLFWKWTVKMYTSMCMPTFTACDFIYLTRGEKSYAILLRRSEKGVGHLVGKCACALGFRHVWVLQTKEIIKGDK